MTDREQEAVADAERRIFAGEIELYGKHPIDAYVLGMRHGALWADAHRPTEPDEDAVTAIETVIAQAYRDHFPIVPTDRELAESLVAHGLTLGAEPDEDVREALAGIVNDRHESTRNWAELKKRTGLARTNGDDYAIRAAYSAADAILARFHVTPLGAEPDEDSWEYILRTRAHGDLPVHSLAEAEHKLTDIRYRTATIMRRPRRPDWEPVTPRGEGQ